MDEKYLVVNSGSASHKHALYRGDVREYFIHFEIVEDKFIAHETIGETKTDIEVSGRVFTRSIDFTVDRLIFHKLIADKKSIKAVGIRIVAPGIFFQDNRLIDRVYEKNLKRAREKAPLHLSSVLAEIKFIRKALPKSPIIGVSDSVFHKTMPDTTKYYALRLDVSRKYEVYRYGYHGLSVQSVIARLKAQAGGLSSKIVVCHLGGGASVTAVRDGQSLDNTMGFSPTDGLVMASRVGTIDPGAVIYLSEKLGLRDGDLLNYFNKNCGLLGLSNGKSDDIRELLKLEKMGDFGARLALEVYALRVKKMIAQAAAVLGGIDCLVFAGTVGERSFPMRERICHGLDFLGIKLDPEINDKSDSVEVELQAGDSRVKIPVVKTDEMREIVLETIRLSKQL